MQKQQPLPRDFWAAESQVSRRVLDVNIDVFTGATGRALITFPTHVVYLMESKASTEHSIGDGDPEVVHFSSESLCFIPKDLPLSCRPIKPFDITIVAIPEHWFKRAIRGSVSYDLIDFTYFNTDDDKVLLHAVLLLKDIALDATDSVPPDFSEALIMSVVTRILRRVCEGASCVGLLRGETLSRSSVDLIDKFVDTNICRSIRLQELADVVGLSVSHFSRAFKALMNETPMRYVLERRITEAKRLLAIPSVTLASIAFDTGFSSQSHFTTSFRQMTGMTPSAWRAALSALIAGYLALLFDLHEHLHELLFDLCC